MSELTKTALANMQAKRIKRIEDAAKRSQIPDIATYQGKSTIDGTDIVQVGSNEPTSGFRLISNAPLTVGEKVSLRPSAIGGLQRIDARNRPIDQPVAQPLEQLFAFLDLTELAVRGFTGFDFIASSSLPSLQKQRWIADSQGNAQTFDGWERPTFPENVYVGTGFEGATYTYSATKEWIELTTSLGAGVTNTVLVDLQFSLPSEFNKILDELDLIDEDISPTSKLEAEIESSFGTLDRIFFDADIFAFSASFSGADASVASYTFRFRYRRRGKLRWFEL